MISLRLHHGPLTPHMGSAQGLSNATVPDWSKPLDRHSIPLSSGHGQH
jgi:hypothetical protein